MSTNIAQKALKIVLGISFMLILSHSIPVLVCCQASLKCDARLTVENDIEFTSLCLSPFRGDKISLLLNGTPTIFSFPFTLPPPAPAPAGA